MIFGVDQAGDIRAYGSASSNVPAAPASPRLLVPPTPAPSAANPFLVTARFDPATVGLDRPIALAVGPGGDIYVTDAADDVTRVSATGGNLLQWGRKGSNDGEFEFGAEGDPTVVHGSVAVGPDGHVYVSDSGNHRVEVFTADGKYVRQFGGFGTGPGQFVTPFDLSVDSLGNVYVLDDDALTLSKFSPKGAFGGASTAPRTWSSVGTGMMPTSIRRAGSSWAMTTPDASSISTRMDRSSTPSARMHVT